jgi:hypothetical protein
MPIDLLRPAGINMSYWVGMVSSMSEHASSLFSCPACGAHYTVVRMAAEPGETPDEELQCRNCGGPLDAREGDFILKYFLVGPPKKGRRRK